MATETPHIRRATIEDVPHILALIKELADFEHAPDRVHATEASLRATLTFAPSPSNPSPQPGYADTFLLTVTPSSSQGEAEEVAGFALFYYTYSTWTSRPGVYLEDLFVRPAHRRKGYATMLFRELAGEVARVSGGGAARLEWACLKWNQGALEFYERIGGVRMDEWVEIRVEGEEVDRLARGEAKLESN